MSGEPELIWQLRWTLDSKLWNWEEGYLTILGETAGLLWTCRLRSEEVMPCQWKRSPTPTRARLEEQPGYLYLRTSPSCTGSSASTQPCLPEPLEVPVP